MKGRNKLDKYNMRTPQISLNTRNLFTSYKKNLAKVKYFSISSKEDIVKNKLANPFLSNEPKVQKNKIKKETKTIPNNCIETPKFLSHNISKYKTNFNSSKFKKKKKNFSLSKKIDFKKTIIIDNEGNNNLNINKHFFKQSTSLKVCLLNSNKNHKINIKPISKNKKNKKSFDVRNNIIQNLLNFYKAENLETISSTVTETNSLFLNSKIIKEKKVNNTKIFLNIEEEDKDNTQRENKINQDKKINEYKKLINLVRIDSDQIKNRSEKKLYRKSLFSSNKSNNIIDYISFIKNIPKSSNNINLLEYKENFDVNNNDLKSFLESSLQDDFYQTLIYKKSIINKNMDEDSFNLSKSISEFNGKNNDKKQYDFEKIIHSPVKKGIQFKPIFYNKNNNTKDKKGKLENNINIKKENEFTSSNKLNDCEEEKNNINNRNNLCNIF
jgi:hypothetical protein